LNKFYELERSYYKIHGIDVSHHQDEINWEMVRKAGVRFAFIKASEGEEYVDPMFDLNMHGAVEAGVLPGSYHFFLPRYDPLAQARHYARTLQENAVDAPTLPPCVDLETPGLGKSGLNQALRIFMEEIFTLTGRKCILYVSPGFWNSYLPVPVLSGFQLLRSGGDWAVDYPLWLAHYTSGWPYQIYPWVSWRFWQYTSAGKIAGVNTKADLDYFNGSLEDLFKLAAA
jgi:GH25 family lysozyme M1 (1,4-beta-N-acetylmuramidase)